MITHHDNEGWGVSGEGYLRPIAISGCDTEWEAVKAYGEQFLHQQGEEYAFYESMSHLSNCRDGQPYGEDLG